MSNKCWSIIFDFDTDWLSFQTTPRWDITIIEPRLHLFTCWYTLITRDADPVLV